MRTYRIILVASLLSSFVFGCSANPVSQEDTTIADLAGTWDTSSIVYQDKQDTSHEIDAATLGESRVLTFEPNGSYVMQTKHPHFSFRRTGTARIEDDKLFLNEGVVGIPEEEYYFTLESDELIILSDHAQVDFNGDGSTEEANEMALYVKE